MVRFLGLAQIAPFSGAHIKKMAKSSFQGKNGINWQKSINNKAEVWVQSVHQKMVKFEPIQKI